MHKVATKPRRDLSPGKPSNRDKCLQMPQRALMLKNWIHVRCIIQAGLFCSDCHQTAPPPISPRKWPRNIKKGTHRRAYPGTNVGPGTAGLCACHEPIKQLVEITDPHQIGRE